YGAVVQIPSSGIWKLKVNIQHNSETESVSTLLKVSPPPSPPLAYWHLFILPPLVVLGFIVNRTARRKSGIRSQKSGAQKCADFDPSIFGNSSHSDKTIGPSTVGRSPTGRSADPPIRSAADSCNS